MPDKPSFASEYSRKQAELVRQTCLYAATKLGDPDGVGPRRVAEFMYRSPNDEVQADVAGFVRELLRKCGTA